jgi:hypothetical protein
MTKELGKSEYSAPKLVEYGSVRNLTGGSAGPRGDTGTMRV